MSQIVTAIFDGNVFRPDTPLNLEPDKRYVIKIEAEARGEGIPFEIDGEVVQLNPNSAEGKAVQRLENIDFEDDRQWITEGEIGTEIDVNAINQRLKERGDKIQVSFTDSPPGES